MHLTVAISAGDLGASLKEVFFIGRSYLFCAVGCAETFDADPDRYATSTFQSH